MKTGVLTPAVNPDETIPARAAGAAARTSRERFVSVLVLAACLLAVWSVLDGWTWSLARVTTTGCEEEALFSIWKFARGEAIYSSPGAMPYSVSYFNWLFFLIYGGAAKVAFGLFHFGSDALPAIARLVTVAFAFGCVAILYSLLGRLGPARLVNFRPGRFALSLFLVINPLTSSWLFTTRPDIAALSCELLGLSCALRYFEKRNVSSLIAAALAGYAAWSFKHNFVHLLGGFFLLLAWRREWRALGLLTLIGIGLTGATLLLGGSEYRHALIGAQLNCEVSAHAAWMFFKDAAGLAPQLAAVALGLLVSFAMQKRWSQSVELRLIALIAGVALMFGFLGASKQGADTNYFIPVSIFGVVWALGLRRARQENPAVSAGSIAVVFCTVLGLFGAGVLIGLKPYAAKAASQVVALFTHQPSGANETAANTGQAIARLKQNLEQLPAPVFLTDRACNLPWIQTKPPHFVYSFTYALDRRAGLPFERGGIGGLIEGGYFETIVVLERNCACESASLARTQCSHVTMNHLPLVKDGDVPSIDGGRLTHYRLAFRDGWFAYYLKRKS